MLGAVHCTGVFVIGGQGKVYKLGASHIRVEQMHTRCIDLRNGWEPSAGFPNEAGECPASPLVSTVCVSVTCSSNLGVVVSSAGTMFSWGQYMKHNADARHRCVLRPLFASTE